MNKNILSKINFSRVIERREELKLYKDVFRNIISYLEDNDKASFQQIIKYVGGSDRRTLRLLDQLVSLGVLRFKYPYFYLADKKNKFPISIDDVRCLSCDSKVVNIHGKMGKIYKKMRSIFKRKPIPTFIFDQRPVNLETTIRRAAYAIWRGDIQSKKIAVIGDDDMTSLALAFTKMAKEIVVFDIDKRILDYIKQISKTYRLGIKTVHCDLTKGVPRRWCGHFDVFTTDPTPTKNPFTLFINIGVKLLKPVKGSIGYTSIYPSCKTISIDLQKILTRMNLLITDIIPFFTQYDFIEHTYSESDLKLLKKYASPESKISFFESLVRVITTDKTKILNVKFSPSDIIGTATERVLKDKTKDPLLGMKSKTKEKVYVDRAASNLKRLFTNKNQK